MKKITYLFFCLSANLSMMAQDGILWSPPVSVSTSAQGDDSPRIALLSDGTPAALWGRNFKIYFSREIDGAFTEPMEISTAGVTPDIYGFGGLDMAAHGDDVFLVFENFSDGLFLIHSGDGGQTFDAPVSVFDPAPGLWATLATVEVDDEGNPLVSVILENTNETEGRYVMLRSNDGGLSFEPHVVASEPAAGDYVCECCPSDIYTEAENIFLIFRNNDDNLRDMWVSRSTDGGTSFATATDVDDTDWVINACPISGPRLAPLANDSLITIWMSGASGNGRVSFSTLHSGTMEKGWEMETPQTNENSNQVRPDVAGRNDTIGVVWEENGFGLNGTDLMFAFSKNGTTGLASNLANLTEATGSQRYPALAYSDGTFHLLFADGTGGLSYLQGTVSEVNHSSSLTVQSEGLKIIPQPAANGAVQLHFANTPVGPLDLNLVSASGKSVRQWKVETVPSESFLEVKIEGVPSGMYFLEVSSTTTRFVEKLIVAH